MNKRKASKTVMQMLDDLMEDIPRTNVDISNEPTPVLTTIEVPTEYEDEEDRKDKKVKKK